MAGRLFQKLNFCTVGGCEYAFDRERVRKSNPVYVVHLCVREREQDTMYKQRDSNCLSL